MVLSLFTTNELEGSFLVPSSWSRPALFTVVSQSVWCWMCPDRWWHSGNPETRGLFIMKYREKLHALLKNMCVAEYIDSCFYICHYLRRLALVPKFHQVRVGHHSERGECHKRNELQDCILHFSSLQSLHERIFDEESFKSPCWWAQIGRLEAWEVSLLDHLRRKILPHFISFNSLHEGIFDEELFKVPAGEQLYHMVCLDPPPSKLFIREGSSCCGWFSPVITKSGDFGLPSVCKEERSINYGSRRKEKNCPLAPEKGCQIKPILKKIR